MKKYFLIKNDKTGYWAGDIFLDHYNAIKFSNKEEAMKDLEKAKKKTLSFVQIIEVYY